MDPALTLALTAGRSTFGLIVTFFVAFPVLVNVLVLVSMAQGKREKADNERFRDGLADK